MVAVRDGSIQSAKETPKEDWSRLLDKWQGFAYFFPDDCRKLKQMRDEISELEIWRELGYENTDDLIADKLLIDPRTVELVCLGLDVTDTESPVPMEEALSKGEQMAKEKVDWTARVEAGESYRAIAKDEGVAHTTVARRVEQKNSLDTKTAPPEKRKKIQLNLNSGTTPDTAAWRIREKFGDEFANQLKDAL